MVGRLSRLSKKKAAEHAAEVLERVSLTDAADRPLKTYSGGMRRRIDLGAGLVAHPQVLLLDEPTTGLDPANRMDLWAYLRELVAEGATILLTTQYLEEADQLANEVVVIDHGSVIAEGTPLELKQRLAGDVLDVTVDDANLDRVGVLLGGVGTEPPTIDRGTRHVSLPIAGGAASLVEAVRRLDEEHIQVVDILLRRPSLDDVFLALTGHTTTADDTDSTATVEECAMSTATTTPEPATRPTVSNRLPRGATLADAGVIAQRNIKHLLRTPQLLVFSVAQTVMFLLLFRYVFGGSIHIPGLTYVNFLIPGYLATIAIFDGFGVSIFFAEDSEVGVDRTLPRVAHGALGRRRRTRHRRPPAAGRAARDHDRRRRGRGLPLRGEFRRHRAGLRDRADLGLRVVLGVRRHRAVRARHRDRPGCFHPVLHPGVRVVGGDPGRHVAGLAPAVRPEPTAEPGGERDPRPHGRQRRCRHRARIDDSLRDHVAHLVRRAHRGVRAARDLRLPPSLIPPLLAPLRTDYSRRPFMARSVSRLASRSARAWRLS